MATSYSNLALALQDLGDVQGAKKRLEQAIEIDEAHFLSMQPPARDLRKTKTKNEPKAAQQRHD